MQVGHVESLILFVADLGEARSFYVGALGLRQPRAGNS